MQLSRLLLFYRSSKFVSDLVQQLDSSRSVLQHILLKFYFMYGYIAIWRHVLSVTYISVDLVLLLNLHVTETFCSIQLNLIMLLARMWEDMDIVSVYTKPQGLATWFLGSNCSSTVCSLPLYAFSPQNLMKRALINNLVMAFDLGQDLHQVLLQFVTARSTCPCTPEEYLATYVV